MEEELTIIVDEKVVYSNNHTPNIDKIVCPVFINNRTTKFKLLDGSLSSELVSINGKKIAYNPVYKKDLKD